MKQSLNILISYLTCTDPIIQNKWLNLLHSFWHKDAGWLIKAMAVDASGYKITVVDSNGNEVDHIISIPTIPNSQGISYITGLQNALDGKVDKSAGKGLSTNDFTTALKSKLDGLSNYVHPTFHQISEVENLQAALDAKVTVVPGKDLSTNDFTTALKDKLTGLDDNHFKGVHPSESALNTAHPTASAGDYADVDAGVSNDVQRFIWDIDDAKWVIQGSGGSETAASIKTKYESNPDTNAFTDAEKTNLANQSGSNTGDEDQASIQAKRPLKTINGSSIEGNGDLLVGDGLTSNDVQDIVDANIIQSEDVTGSLLDGYINAAGNLVDGSPWQSTDFIPVIEGETILYTGDTNNYQNNITGYDSTRTVITELLQAADTFTDHPIVIPAGVVEIRATTIDYESPLVVKKENYKWVNTNLENSKLFVPKNGWALNGDVFKMNPYGILGKHPEDRSFDIVWSQLRDSNENQFIYTPQSETYKDVTMLKSNLNNQPSVIGTVRVLVSQSPSNPASPHYFIYIGDSLGSNGQIIEELSRRLTGTGAELLSGAQSPAANNYSNINFLGTLGSTVKHEARGGWGFDTYLNTQASNPFYSTVTSKFDIDHYLSDNSFSQVSATGDNLTILFHLGWNNVYNNTNAEIQGYIEELLDIIAAQKPSAMVKLIGLATPPHPIKKSFDGRQISYQSIMENVVINFSNICQGIADDATYNSFVEHIPIAPFFFPQHSFPSATEGITPRHTETYTVYTDEVHPNDVGRAQIADVLYYNILYNYCD